MIEKITLRLIHWIGSVSSLIIHTILFTISFILYIFNIFDRNTILLIVTTIVSLEAIYLSIFIQMSVNLQSKKLQSVAEDVEDIQENVEDIQENVEDIQEDVEDIQESVDEFNEDEEDEEEDEDIKEIHNTMKVVQDTLEKLMKEVVELKKRNKK